MNSKHKKSLYFSDKGLFSGLKEFQEVEARITGLPQTERGDAFEVFAEAYFATQKFSQAAAVWVFDNIPVVVRAELGLADRDRGIDGIIKTNDDLFDSYQVKYRTNRENLTWQEVSTFMGLSDRTSKRILFTNSVDLPQDLNARTNFYAITGNDLDRLEERDFQVIEEWLKSGRIYHEKAKPRLHQIEALNAVEVALENNDRVTVVMACGTGKTLLSLWIAEQQNAQSILVLLPSLSLVRQTLHNWVKETNWNDFSFLCVCSDKTVARNDDIIVQQTDCDFPVTTDAAEVNKFLTSLLRSRKIIFSTYQSCKLIPKEFIFDLGIFDEAHKTAGREGTNFAFALQDEHISIRKRIFLTATPRHYDIMKKDKEGDARLVFSMDNQQVYGPTCHRLSFAQAAKREIICNYKVIISVVTSDDLNKEKLQHGEVNIQGDLIKAYRIANILALSSAIERFNIKRIFTFHNSVKAAESFTSYSSEGVSTFIKDFNTFHVNGGMSTSKRELILRDFKNSSKAVMSNARCLTEGVDVPVVDMVAFISPKKSRVDIVQAAGRAMRKAVGKEYGYILIPIFLEVAQGETLEQALEKTQFDDIWRVLQAIQEHDESLVEIIGQMRQEIGRTGSCSDHFLREKVEVLAPEVCLTTLCQVITTKMVDRLGATWDERFGELLKFKDQYEHCNVLAKYPDNEALGTWVSTQRTRYKKGSMPRNQIEKLNSIDFSWEKLKEDFQVQYDYLMEFRNKNPNRWPNQEEEFPKGNPLGKWCAWKRSNKRNLEQWKIDLLNTVGFPWNLTEDFFEIRYTALIEFKRKFPNRWPEFNEEFPEGIKLGIWCDSLRQRYKKKSIKDWQIKKLETIGFPWNLEEFYWLQQYEYLLAFRKINSNRWPKEDELFPGENKLGMWCATQKDRCNRRNTLLDWQMQKLLNLGFPLERDLEEKRKEDWLKQYNYLFEFRAVYPDRWPRNIEEFPNKNKLGNWCKMQRARCKKLADWQISKLNEISFPWKADIEQRLQNNWLKKYNHLIEFRKKFPNRWPKSNEQFPANNKLGQWCSYQRYQKDLLCKSRIRKLDDIGFPWR